MTSSRFRIIFFSKDSASGWGSREGGSGGHLDPDLDQGPHRRTPKLRVRPGNRGFGPPHFLYQMGGGFVQASGFRSGFSRPAMWALMNVFFNFTGGFKNSRWSLAQKN
jgi:hypothetical protein